MSDEQTQNDTDTAPAAPADDFAALEKTLARGETLIRGVVTRIIERKNRPIVHIAPTSDVRSLDLEGHRLGTGDLLFQHDKGDLPQRIDETRVAGKLAVGERVGIVHLSRPW